MRLVFVLEDLLTGGAQVLTTDLVLRLRRRGLDVQVLVLGACVAPALAERLGDGMVVLGQSGLKRPAEWRRLAHALVAARADVVFAVNPVATCVAAAARAFGLRAPLASVVHSTGLQGRAAWVRVAPTLAAIRICNALVYVSERQRRHWRRRGLGARQVAVIRNGVDLARHVPVDAATRTAAKAALGLDPRALTLGCVAMFRPEKNHPQLLGALAALHRAGVAAQLLLVGDGPTRVAVERQAGALGITSMVRFCGEQADVRPFLSALDVGVLCSTSVETLPLFGLELMAAGAPLVASRVGGLDELVEDGVDGLLFPARDTAALIRQLKRCADPVVRARLSAGALAKARAFDAELMAESYAALARSLVRRLAA